VIDVGVRSWLSPTFGTSFSTQSFTSSSILSSLSWDFCEDGPASLCDIACLSISVSGAAVETRVDVEAMSKLRGLDVD
jgi:hypothetical protein